MKMRPLVEADYPALWEIVQVEEPFADRLIYDEFVRAMRIREGFTVLNNTGEIVGYVAFSCFIPGCAITLNATIKKEFHGRWLNRQILWQMFDFPFNKLGLVRVSSFAFEGVTERAARGLMQIGFIWEGRSRKAFKVAGNFYNVLHFGMLREECRWI